MKQKHVDIRANEVQEQITEKTNQETMRRVGLLWFYSAVKQKKRTRPTHTHADTQTYTRVTFVQQGREKNKQR